MRRFGLLGVLLIGLLSVTLLQPANAQGTWCYTFDFTADDGDFSLFAGTDGNWVDGLGWETAYWVGDDTNDYHSVALTKNFTGNIGSVDLTVHLFAQGSPAYPTNWAHLTVDGEDIITTGTTPGVADDYHYGWTGDMDVTTGIDLLQLSSGFYNGPGAADPGGDAVIQTLSLSGQGTNPFGEDNCEPPAPAWTRPLLEADEYPERPLYDYDDAFHAVFGEDDLPDPSAVLAAPPTIHRVTAVSSEAGAPVMAAQGGTVHIVYSDATMCSVWGVLLANQCWFVGPRLDANQFPLYAFNIDSSVQLVTIDLEDGTQLRYMVQNGNEYVHDGQTINEGCVIGETIQAAETTVSDINHELLSGVLSAFPALGAVISHGEQPDFAVSFAEYHGDPDEGPIELLDHLAVYNTEAEPCNINANFRDCLVADPDLTHGADAWTLFGDAEANDAGVSLGPGGYISQTVNVPDVPLHLRIGYYYDILTPIGNTSPRAMNVNMGALGITEIVQPTNQYQELSIPITDPEADPGGTGFTVKIQDYGPVGGLIIAAACLTADDHELNPRMCYFANPDFDSLEGWVSTTTQTGNGFVSLGDEDFVSQDDITLLPNEDDSPRTYHLEVDVRAIAAPGQTFNPSSGSAVMDYSWDELVTIGTLDLTWNQPGEPGFPDAYQTLSTDIVVTEPTTANFIIFPDITDNETMRVALSRACIGTDDLPPGNGVGGPFQTTCSAVPVPTDDSIGSWTMFHWRNLDRFFNCRLMVLLNKWFNLFDQFRITMLKVARYWIALVNKGANWLTTVFYWLNGSVRNIITGQGALIVQQDTGCHDFWCTLTSFFDVLFTAINGLLNISGQIVSFLIALVTQAVNLLFTIVVGAIVFVIKVIGLLLSILQLGQSLLASIISAYNNAVPITIPGMPSCSLDPQASGFCIAVWVMDNTIFSGPGALIIPLLVAIGSINLLLWVIAELRNTVIQVGASA